MLPERSTSKRSNSVRQEARKDQRPQNSSKPMLPLRSESNMRIIMRTVWMSKAVQSPLTRAAESSFSVSWPVPFARPRLVSFLHVIACFYARKSPTILVYGAKEGEQCRVRAAAGVCARCGRRRRSRSRRSSVISSRRRGSVPACVCWR